MRIQWRALLLLMMFVAGTASADDLLSADVLDMFAEVLGRGYYGLRDEETAAFIIRRHDGGERCVLWPQTAEFHATRYRWPPPQGVIAIVHTHPVATPDPSAGDRASAVRLGIPIYAITMANIYKADSFGAASAIVKGRRWFHDQNSGRQLCELVSREELWAEDATVPPPNAPELPEGVAVVAPE